ncbi:heme-binding protein [Sphingomonas sp. LaA6.9]|uniref:GlcG/HbpS family heme-binding protein n=1 Tax=Sphingomonas sp. LaA6.9 TaxID=2919914 RepID=UPI001F4FB0F5|nr:heme-binding protein [Sphingomonas sp. LaA6.9]MCJ8157067.1 heme-binding protein [Sphingomonas sp. LaA6.9]
MTNTKTLSQSLIGYELASEAIAAGVAAARERKVALSFVVLDAAGHLVASARMDGAAFITIEVARGKAFASAATGGQPGLSLGQRYNDNPMVWGNVSSLGFGAPLLPAQGALPIFLEGQFIGVMGASGAPSEIDDAVVTCAVEAIGCTVSA